jgi:hypothetical protein
MTYIDLYLKIGEQRLPASCVVQAILRVQLLGKCLSSHSRKVVVQRPA